MFVKLMKFYIVSIKEVSFYTSSSMCMINEKCRKIDNLPFELGGDVRLISHCRIGC